MGYDVVRYVLKQARLLVNSGVVQRDMKCMCRVMVRRQDKVYVGYGAVTMAAGCAIRRQQGLWAKQQLEMVSFL
jgi:hypothetical protein